MEDWFHEEPRPPREPVLHWMVLILAWLALFFLIPFCALAWRAGS